MTRAHACAQVVRESGPPHLRVYITRCTCGGHVTEGEANGKQASKRRAAERMLQQLATLSPLPPSSPVVATKGAGGGAKKGVKNKPRQSKNLIKVGTFLCIRWDL